MRINVSVSLDSPEQASKVSGEELTGCIKEEILAFEEWFRQNTGTGLISAEHAILSSYLYYKAKSGGV